MQFIIWVLQKEGNNVYSLTDRSTKPNIGTYTYLYNTDQNAQKIKNDKKMTNPIM